MANNEKKYQNVTISIEERVSSKSGKPYIATVGYFKNSRGETVEVILGFDKLAKDIVFNV